jgi:hypothetical protein
VFGAASKIDWNAENPLETGKTALAHLSQEVTAFTSTDNQNKVAAAVTRGLAGEQAGVEALVTRLTREQEDATKEPADAVNAVESEWEKAKTTDLERVNGQITAIQEEIKKIKEAGKNDVDPEVATANDFVRALNAQKEVLTRRAVAPLQKELVEYRNKQAQLINQVRLITQVKNETLKAIAGKTTKTASDDKLESAAKALKTIADKTPTTDLPPTVSEKLAAATSQSDALKAKIQKKETTAKETMSQLESLGSGLASVGNAIINMATPISEADPTVQRLANGLLETDPELRVAGQRLTSKLEGWLARKKQAATGLIQCRQALAAGLDLITRNLATMSALSRQRQSIDLGLYPAAQAYLKETRDAAKDALAESIYWFVKSHHYEFLTDVQDSFFNFDTWTAQLRTQENTRQEEIRKKNEGTSTSPEPASAGGVVTRAPKFFLTKEEFLKVGNDVFKAEQEKLGTALLGLRQNRKPEEVYKYTDCVLQRSDDVTQYVTDKQKRQNEMLDALARGEVVFDFVRDFGAGKDDWNKARVVKVVLVKLDIETNDPRLKLTFRVEQRGDMTIKVDEHCYRFRPGYSDPIGWGFSYNHQNKNDATSGITPGKPPDDDHPVDAAVRALLHDDLKNLTFKEYQPALFSDYVIRITDLSEEKKQGLKINELNMTVYISYG